MNTITVLFFATLREKIGIKFIHLEIPRGTRIAGLKALLCANYHHIQELVDASLIAINREYATDNSPIPNGAEVAIFPAVSF